MILPDKAEDLKKVALKWIDDCRVSQSRRMASYRAYGQVIETGRQSGGLALANLIYSHIDRLAAHLFSPSELRFSIDYENIYPKEWLEKGAVTARVVSREWERKNIDMLFGHGVKEALAYASCILKQLAGKDAEGNFVFRGARLIMPWSFGVYNEGVNDLGDQEAFCETVWLTRPEVWRRVRNLPNAEAMFKRIMGNAKKDDGAGIPNSFMHQVLSTAVLNTTGQGTTQPGGIVQLSSDAGSAQLGPEVAAELFPMNELWVRDDSRGDDYTTIQIIEPDILIAPLFKHTNLFVPETQPYTLIQPNYEPGYFWGRSEIVDLQMLQSWLTEHLDDIKKLMGQQIDKIIAFPGYDGITEELYAQFRAQGFMGLPSGASVEDLTPKIPDQAIPLVAEIIALMERVSGFPPIMSGQGEPGVRAGVHADTLMKTGSPRLRDRSLLVERQCASAADTTLACLEAKDAKAYWLQPGKEETEFLLSQLPEDRRIVVDAHSASPIFHDDHMQLLAFGLKAGIVTGESFIEDSPLSHKDKLLTRLRQKQENELRMIQEHPDLIQGGPKKRQAVVSHAAEGPQQPDGHMPH